MVVSFARCPAGTLGGAIHELDTIPSDFQAVAGLTIVGFPLVVLKPPLDQHELAQSPHPAPGRERVDG